MTPSLLVERYFACMRARDLEGLLALFVEDARVVLPDGREVHGLAPLRGMYQHIFAAGAPSPSPQAVVLAGDAAAVEIEASLPDGVTRRTANFFHLAADGRIAGLSIYKRGDW